MFLFYRHNYRLTKVHTASNDKLPVATKSGDSVFVQFLGFIDIEEAKLSPNAKPCKIIGVEAYSFEGELQRVALPDNHALQGCLVNGGVYCVTDERMPKLIRLPKQSTTKKAQLNNIINLPKK